MQSQPGGIKVMAVSEQKKKKIINAVVKYEYQVALISELFVPLSSLFKP